MIVTEIIPDPQRKLDECVEIPINPFNWRAYNNSQMREKLMFLNLLDDLCQMVDDDKNFLLLTEKTLDVQGYEVETNTSPMQALLRLLENKNSYNLLITDVNMPLIFEYFDRTKEFVKIIRTWMEK